MLLSSWEPGRDIRGNLMAETSACPITAEYPKHWEDFAVIEEVTDVNYYLRLSVDKILGDIPA